MSRIYESCVSSEDIKHMAGADRIISLQSIGLGITLTKDVSDIGRIMYLPPCFLGDDFIIDKIIINNDRELSEKMTDRYRGKILIMSEYSDTCN